MLLQMVTPPGLRAVDWHTCMIFAADRFCSWMVSKLKKTHDAAMSRQESTARRQKAGLIGGIVGSLYHGQCSSTLKIAVVPTVTAGRSLTGKKCMKEKFYKTSDEERHCFLEQESPPFLAMLLSD